MNVSQLVADNLLSPAILCFALGALATFLRSDLKLPDQVFSALSIYLMLAIGIKGGVELAGRPMSEVAAPLAGAFALGCAIPLWCYALLRRFGNLSVPDAAALAAHYGSVSAVTFAAVTTLLDRQGAAYEGYMPALLAVMEVPALVIAIGLARIATAAAEIRVHASGVAIAGGPTPPALPPMGGVWAAMRWRRDGATTTRATLAAISALTVFVFAVGTAFEIGENERFRYMVEPIMFILLARVATELLNRFRSRRAGKNPQPISEPVPA